jgi:hypothetical protein
MRTLALRVVKDATLPDNLTVREVGGNNRGPAVETYLRSVGLGPGNPWCAAYVRYRFEKGSAETGVALPAGMPDSGYTPTWKNWAEKKGLFVPVSEAVAGKFTPRAGDLVLFYFANLDGGRIGHIGIVTEPWYDGGKLIGARTVEGNTGPDAGSSVERAGDGVYLKRRRFGQLGLRGGFVRIEA